ncbi:excisionase [Candidatus Methanoprimaticola sp. MG2]|uniref:excisionase n=1 Tax=Candidatus Methanoprimaticola sp. MG2 TaxID=3228838 RepID=UPI0039C6B078
MAHYDLMHKDLLVSELDMDLDTGLISSVVSVSRLDHMPVRTVRGGHPDSKSLKDWWSGRSIPVSRTGIRDLCEYLGIGAPFRLLMESNGLCLSDHYWIRQHNADLSWSSVNFLENDFSEDMGDLLFGRDVPERGLDLSSPDSTTEGNLRKKWKIIGSKRRLLKSGTPPINQEPFNEVIAAHISEALGIPHVDYDLISDGRLLCSACDDFIDGGSEFVSAYNVMVSTPRSNNTTSLDHYVGCCREHGIDITHDVDMMLVLDYLMVNVDRHTNNFGIIRDPDTLEWKGASPIFDTGASLGFDKIVDDIQYASSDRCKPFRKSFDDQLTLVSDLDWVDMDALRSSLDGVEDILGSADGAVPEDRRDAIMLLLRSRISSLERRVRAISDRDLLSRR